MGIREVICCDKCGADIDIGMMLKGSIQKIHGGRIGKRISGQLFPLVPHDINITDIKEQYYCPTCFPKIVQNWLKEVELK